MNTRKHNHYFKDVQHLQYVDVYRVLALFNVTDPCIQHAVKKLLVAGGRGAGKDITRDIKEAVDSLQRWQEMRDEDGADMLPAAVPAANPAPVEQKLDRALNKLYINDKPYPVNVHIIAGKGKFVPILGGIRLSPHFVEGANFLVKPGQGYEVNADHHSTTIVKWEEHPVANNPSVTQDAISIAPRTVLEEYAELLGVHFHSSIEDVVLRKMVEDKYKKTNPSRDSLQP